MGIGETNLIETAQRPRRSMLFWMLDVPESTCLDIPSNIPRQGHFQIFPGLMVKLGETEMQAPCSGDQALDHGSPQALIPAVIVGFQSGLGVVEPWNPGTWFKRRVRDLFVGSVMFTFPTKNNHSFRDGIGPHQIKVAVWQYINIPLNDIFMTVPETGDWCFPCCPCPTGSVSERR